MTHKNTNQNPNYKECQNEILACQTFSLTLRIVLITSVYYEKSGNYQKIKG